MPAGLSSTSSRRSHDAVIQPTRPAVDGRDHPRHLIGEHLAAAARTWPDDLAVVEGDAPADVRQLDERVERSGVRCRTGRRRAATWSPSSCRTGGRRQSSSRPSLRIGVRAQPGRADLPRSRDVVHHRPGPAARRRGPAPLPAVRLCRDAAALRRLRRATTVPSCSPCARRASFRPESWTSARSSSRTAATPTAPSWATPARRRHLPAALHVGHHGRPQRGAARPSHPRARESLDHRAVPAGIDGSSVFMASPVTHITGYPVRLVLPADDSARPSSCRRLGPALRAADLIERESVGSRSARHRSCTGLADEYCATRRTVARCGPSSVAAPTCRRPRAAVASGAATPSWRACTARQSSRPSTCRQP